MIANLMHRISGRLTDYLHPSLASPQDVERAEEVFYIQYLREGMVAFDVGANIGELTLLFSRFVGETGHVHAFEACRETFEKLSYVCRAANRKNVTVNCEAVSDHAGLVKFYNYGSSMSGFNSLANRPLAQYGIAAGPPSVEDVSATTLDAYCSKNGIDMIDLLKIDVEGAEYQVLLGARKLLEDKRIKCCVFEFGQTTFDMGNKPEEIKAYLKSLGYSLRNIVKGETTFPGGSSVQTAQFSLHVAEPR